MRNPGQTEFEFCSESHREPWNVHKGRDLVRTGFQNEPLLSIWRADRRLGERPGGEHDRAGIRMRLSLGGGSLWRGRQGR